MEEKYRHLVTDGYQFDMGRYISQGWDLFKKGAGSFIGFILLYFIISFVLGLIPFVNFFASFVQQALIAGLFLFCRNLLKQNEEFGDFFGGFKFFGNIVGYILILLLILIPVLALMFGALIPFELLPDLMNADPSNMEYLFEDLAVSFAARLPILFLIILLAMYISVSYSFALPLIADSKLGPWTAMETSRKIIGKKFFPFLGMYVLMGIGAVIGIGITCGLGMLIIVPLMYCIIFSAYNDILQPEGAEIVDQLDEFGKTDTDTNTEAEDR